MRFSPLFILLFLSLAAYGQQTSVAVLPSDGDEKAFNNDDLEALTNKMRSVALRTLPSETFALLTQEVVIKRLGGPENFIKECRESSCIVDLGKKAQVDYIAQASVGKLRNKMRVKVEIYDVSTSKLVGMYDGDGVYFDDYFVLLKAIDENVPNVFKKIPGVVPIQAKAVSPPVASDISGVQSTGGVSGGYLADSRDGKKYKVVKIGKQTWMTESLNYNSSNSKYDWDAAMKACPQSWHLPSNADWEELVRESKSHSNFNKEFGNSQKGDWWSSTELWGLPSAGADFWKIGILGLTNNNRFWPFSKSLLKYVRCVQD